MPGKRRRVQFWVLVVIEESVPSLPFPRPIGKILFEPESPSLGQEITAVNAVVSVFWGGTELIIKHS